MKVERRAWLWDMFQKWDQNEFWGPASSLPRDQATTAIHLLTHQVEGNWDLVY